MTALDIIAQAIQRCGPASDPLGYAEAVLSALLAAGTVEYGVDYGGERVSHFERQVEAVKAKNRYKESNPAARVVQRRVFPLTEEWTTT